MGGRRWEQVSKMSDNVMEKLSALGELLKIGGTEVGVKMNAGMTSMSFKVKELVQGLNQVDKVVEDATAETLDEPDLATNLELCDMKAFSEVAVEQVLDEMVKLIDDPQTVVNNRNKALTLIEAWGESSDELRYLPVYEETYKSLKSRGIRFPGRDNESLAPIFTPPRSVSASESSPNLAQRLDREIPAQTFSAEQTKEAFDVARNSIELLTSVLSSSPQQYAIEGNEALLFEALNVNDEIQKVFSRRLLSSEIMLGTGIEQETFLSDHEESVLWTLTASGQFSIKSAWQGLRSPSPEHSIDYWLWTNLIAPESERLLKNVVRVNHQEEAGLFYIPIFTTISFFLMEKQQCKALYREALKWVTDQPAWKRSKGRDHILPVHHPSYFKSVRRYMKTAIWLLPDMDSTGNWYKPGQVSLEKDLILPYVPIVHFVSGRVG
ncbi:hypothetical protein RHSIM_Rhsim07G0248200 [Rhododendron simsii]|uniref:VHS domain-containing protein n=1 Tax=Rhododendron simsii TaxID=118357 RepID=A0A834LK56_RHOSS|nr:hypothetical protein RHSIM_Rhsim07G0248200 [Rhododendron simsii]